MTGVQTCALPISADGVSVAFEIGPLPKTWETGLKRKLARAAELGGDHSEMTGTPPIVRIRKMNVRQRIHLATDRKSVV